MLGGAELVEVSSDGEPGDKSRFVRAVENAVLDGRADVGVHSAKDLPGEEVEGLEIAAVPAREDPGRRLDRRRAPRSRTRPEGARVGTVSLRRKAQLLAARPDLRILDLNGNVDTRLRKLAEGDYDAIILAAAGLRRLGREDEIGFRLPTARMVPAAGQGALAIQVRTGDEETAATVRTINDEAAFAAAARRARLLHPPRRRLLDPDRRLRRARRRARCGSAPSSASPTAASGSATSSTPTPPTPRRRARNWRSASSAPAPPTSSPAPRSKPRAHPVAHDVDGPKTCLYGEFSAHQHGALA